MTAHDEHPEWAARVLGDLQAFADLGSLPTAEHEDGSLRVRWTMAGQERTADFSPGDRPGEEQVNLLGRSPGAPPLTYGAFLASGEVADLRHLADQTLLWEEAQRAASRQPVAYGDRSVRLDDVWVAPLIEADPTSGTPAGRRNAMEMLVEWVDAPVGPDSTRLLFLTAQAGEGKSTLLRRLTAECAARFAKGLQHRLPLYIDAQSSGLAQLGQAIAKALDDLRSHLTYRSVESLVREDLLVLIIDGFDELIGARGTFDDAFSSLSNFVARLEGRGSVIAATRSVYYEQEYRDRAASLGLQDTTAYELEPYRLVPWDDERRNDYQDLLLDAVNVNDDERPALRRALDDVAQGDAADLLRKPLFARDVSVLVLQDSLAPHQPDEDVVARLVRSYNVRESGKLVMGGEQVLDPDRLGWLYARVAEEMWDLESREVDPDTLRFVADDVADTARLPESRAALLASRIPYLSMFRQALPGRPYIAFEHELFFWYFLARAFGRQTATQSGWQRRMLAKAAISSEAADFAAADMTAAGGGPQGALDLLRDIAQTPGPRALQVAENAGQFAGAILRAASRNGTADNLRVQGLTFAGVDFTGLRLHGSAFEQVDMNRCDLTNATMDDCTSRGLFLREILVDPETTRLDLTGLRPGHNVIGLQTAHAGAIRTEYDPAKVLAVLQRLGAADVPPPEPLHDVPDDTVDLTERLCRAYSRRNKIGTGYEACADLFEDPRWPELRDALLEHHLITQEHQPASGRPQEYYRRRFAPDELMSGLWTPSPKPGIDEFWRRVAQPE